MSKVSLWDRLLTARVLKRGWHIARTEARQDFAEDLYAADVLAVDLDSIVRETINRLRTRSYLPSPLVHVEVPKGALGFRPGTVMAMQDRMVLSAIVFLLAPRLDKKLPKAVYSWRVKKPTPKRGSIFQETTIVDLPFLKRKTITTRLDPFDPWYLLWPEFDKQSRQAFAAHRYMATSDIAAYFENIQLPILRDQLLAHFPEDSAVINLLFTFLESWALPTGEGRPYLRGIPQGSSTAAFLGNIFLLPLDKRFEEFEKKEDIRYFRYMDDVRVFCNELDTARRALFEMTRELRSLHLNVQTAKTRILDERRKEVSSTLVSQSHS